MKLCKYCQTENADDAKFCTACGELMDPEETGCEAEAETAVPPEITAEDTAAAEDTASAVEAETAAETGDCAEKAPEQEDEDGFEVIPPADEVRAPAGKSHTGIIAAGVLAVVLAVGLIVGKGMLDRKKTETAREPVQQTEESAAEDTADSTEETDQETEAISGTDENGVLPGHHVNAYGLNTDFIHYTANDDGTYSYDYQDENGETVSVSAEEVESWLDQEVASAANLKLTNRELMYYYDQQYYSFYSQYYSYLSYFLDMSLPLDEQLSFDGVNSWQQNFVSAGVSMFHQTAAVCAAAEAEGFEMSEEEQEAVASVATNMDESALQYGYTSGEEYLQSYFGPGASMDTYVEFYKLSQYANAYLTSIQEAMTVTDEELETYYDENADTMQNTYGIEKIDQPNVNVRHILITPETTTDDEGNSVTTDEAWAAAEAKAQVIYEEWKSGSATEDSFGELAQTYTDDTGSSTNGGLYEDVYPGQMVTEFNDWCFDESRQPGDTAIVKTTYGYHIMYYVGSTDEIYWRTACESLIASENITNLITQLQEAYPLTADYGKAILLTSQEPTLPTSDSEESDTQADSGTGEENAADGE